MKDNFEMSMMGEMKFVLGLQVHQSPRRIFICQSQYTMDLLKKHRMEKCDSISMPMAIVKLDADLQGTQVDQTKYHSMIGGLMYLTASRPDIAFATFVCASYQAHPTEKRLKKVKRIFRYLIQTINMGLWYSKYSWFELIAYSDVDHAGCNDDCKSTSRGIKFLGDKLVSWSSKKQDCTTMSTAEAEYVSLTSCCAQVIWMRTQLLDYRFRYNKTPMYYDSKSAIAISCNPVQHSRTKYINIRYHFIKEHVEKGIIELYFVGTEYQLADLFTKALPRESIPCSPECKIVGHILLEHPLSYALTATVDVPVVYLQQFWMTFSKVPDTKDTIKFKLYTQEITYTIDMFHDALKLPVETLNNPFIAPVNIKVFNLCLTTQTSRHDQKKINILQLFHAMVNCTNVDYAALFSSGISLTMDCVVSRDAILDAFLTDEIRATDDYAKYETVFVKVAVPINQPQLGKKRKQSAGETGSSRKSLKVTIKQKANTTSIPPPSDGIERDEIAEATLLTLTLHKTALVTEAQENVAKVQEKLAEEEIEKMVEGEEDEESYASEFANSMLNDDVDDSGTRIVGNREKTWSLPKTSRIRLFIKGKKHGRMILDSIDNGPLVYPTVEENGQTRLKKYSELTKEQKLQDDCDVQATNIILHGLPPDVYALVNHHEVAKAIWDKVKLLMKDTELSYQERECRLYDLFDKFALVQGEMFKFVTDVKLAKSLYTTTYDKLYAYLSQHERHANAERIMRGRYPDPLALVADVSLCSVPDQMEFHGTDTPYLLDGYDVLRQWSFDSSKSWIRRIGLE
ncbi:hypothetical protein Tco_0085484 [Tanacetum coccineum]